MPECYVLVHKEAGPLRTFFTALGGQAGAHAVLLDEPDWDRELWIEGAQYACTKWFGSVRSGVREAGTQMLIPAHPSPRCPASA